MPIHTVPCRTDNYCYLIELENSKAILVDASEATPIFEKTNVLGLELTAVLLTHEHGDHIAGLAEILSQCKNIPVYGLGDGQVRLKSATFHFKIDQTLNIEGLEIKTLYTPGHSNLCTSFYIPTESAVFTGDCLFVAGCGRVFTGDFEQMFESLSRLKELPDDTAVYCGHEYTASNLQFALSIEPDNSKLKSMLSDAKIPSVPSSIALEKEINPFFKALDLKQFTQYRKAKDIF